MELSVPQRVSQMLRSIGQPVLASQIEQNPINPGFTVKYYPVQIIVPSVGGTSTITTIMQNAMNLGSYPALQADLINVNLRQSYFLGTVIKATSSAAGTMARYGLQFPASPFRPAYQTTGSVERDAPSPEILMNNIVVTGGSNACSMIGYMITVILNP